MGASQSSPDALDFAGVVPTGGGPKQDAPLPGRAPFDSVISAPPPHSTPSISTVASGPLVSSNPADLASTPLASSHSTPQPVSSAFALEDVPPVDYSDSEAKLKQAKLAACEGELSKVLNYLYVSGGRPAADREALRSKGVTHILNASALNLPNSFAADASLTYLSYKLLDDKTEDLSAFFLQAASFISSARESGGVVLVHCSQGVSRSCTLCVAYLMLCHGQSFVVASAHVKACRAVSSPNCGFLCNLLELDRHLRDARGAATVAPFSSPDNATIIPSESAANLSTCPYVRHFAVLPHAPYDAETLVPKLALEAASRKALVPSLSLLDERTSHVLLRVAAPSDGHVAAVHHGRDSAAANRAAAESFAMLANRFLGAGLNAPAAPLVVSSAVELRLPTGSPSDPTPSYFPDYSILGRASEHLPDALNHKSSPPLPISLPIASAPTGDTSLPVYRGRASDFAADNNRSGSSSAGDCAPPPRNCNKPSLFHAVPLNPDADPDDPGPHAYQWVPISVYDDEDLIPEDLVLLVAPLRRAAEGIHQPPAAYLWVGEAFPLETCESAPEPPESGFDGSDDGGGKAALAVAMLIREAPFSLGWQNVEVMHQGEETDEFWELYEEGY